MRSKRTATWGGGLLALTLAGWFSAAGSVAMAQLLPLPTPSSCLPKHCVLRSVLRREPDPEVARSVLLTSSLRLQPRWLTLSAALSTPSGIPVTTARLTAPALLRSQAKRGAWSAPAVMRQKRMPSVVRDPGVRGSVRLRQGRELSVALTPTPQHCAPLVSMRF